MSQAVKIMIVEDESIVAMDLAMRLQKEGYEIAGMADNCDEALSLFREQQPDLVLMDIHINGEKDGIETAKAIRKIQEVPLIFLTAFSQHEYVTRAKEVNPAAYLVKPFNNDSLNTSIQIAIHNFAVIKNKQAPAKEDKDGPGKEPVLFFNNYFFVKQNYRFTKFSFNDLLFVESDNNYINLITVSKKVVVRISLQTFADSIQHPELVRVHRGYLVNIRHIDNFNEEEIVVGKQHIPIGRSYKDEFLRRFNYL